MGFQEDIQEIKQYLSIWTGVENLDKVNVEALINSKINLLGDSTQYQSISLVENIAQAVMLRDDLSVANFDLDSAKALISKLVQDSMRRNGLKHVEDPALVGSGPDLSRPLADFYGKVPCLHEIVSVEVDGVAMVTKAKSKIYLILHSHNPLCCELVRKQDLDESSARKKDLDEPASWSGFFVDSVDDVTWMKAETKVTIILDFAGGKKKLSVEFLDFGEVRRWISDLRKTKGFEPNSYDQ